MLRHITRSLAFVFFAFSFAVCQTQSQPQTVVVQSPESTSKVAPQAQPIPDIEKRPRMSDTTKLEIIHAMEAEFARTLKNFPVGSKDMILTADGKVRPDDGRLYQLAATYGAAAKVGDRIQITKIAVHDRAVYIEINGGPKKKGHWYQHVQIMGAGGVVDPGGDPNAAQATGAALTLQFKDHVPEMTGPELKQLLLPVFDFSLKTATEVYLETVPPKVKQAIKNHEVLVGMNHDMVVMAKDRPPQKVREKDAKGGEYEEWIYGQPPDDVTFVRFVGDEVIQVKVMRVSGEELVKTEKEVQVSDGVVSMAAATAASISAQNNENQVPQQAGPRPTLKKPGETNTDVQTGPPGSSRPSEDSPNPTDSPNIPTGQLPPVQPPN